MAMAHTAISQYPSAMMTIVPASSISRRGQQIYQQQPGQVVQTRVVQVTQTKSDEAGSPVRKFVNFKNHRDRNRSGRQWEHCEHIAINLSPGELEQRVEQHNYPGNDLITCITSMGIFRQKHLRSYGHKLNSREPEPGNWLWAVEAIGEAKHDRSSVPHTFWAIFRRYPRNGLQQPPVREIVVHNDPSQVVDIATRQPQQTLLVTPALPSPVALSALPPAPTQLTLPPPPSAAAPSTHLVSAPSPQTVQPIQYGATTTTRPITYKPTVATPQIVQPHAGTSVPVPAVASAPNTTASTTTVRQLTQSYGQGNVTSRPTHYTRPIPGVLQRHPSDPGHSSPSDQYRAHDVSSSRFQPTQRPIGQRWQDDDRESLSDDSDSGSYGSSYSTDAMNYTPCVKTRPLITSHSTNQDRERGRGSRSNHRGQISYVPASSMENHGARTYATVIPASSKPTSRRQNTYEVDIKFERASTSRPGSLHRAATSYRTPRSYTRNDDPNLDFESDGVYGKPHGRTPVQGVPRAPMPGTYAGESRYRR